MTEPLACLAQFVEAFNLRNSLGAIYFKANITFKINDSTITKLCEVHIITSNNLSAVYFLNEQKNDDGLPDMVDLKFADCSYIVNECLLIETNSYTISVFPLKAIESTI